MRQPSSRSGLHFIEAVRTAAAGARKAKQEEFDNFGVPELFIFRTNNHGFTWELRRFGGMLLERGIEAFFSEDLARADGKAVLMTLCASAELPSFKRQLQSS